MSDIFISYARSTEAEARRIADALRALGLGIWRDDELPAHRSYAEVIEERLRAAKAVLVIWSAEAVRSEWVQSEADRARATHKLVQLSVDGTQPPMPFDRIQCADLAGWAGDSGAPGWKKVVASIADLVGAGLEASAPQPARSSASVQRRSVCVLPFANMSGEAEQEYFSDGISEDIITDLSKVSALDVTARNTAFAFKGRSVDVRQIAREVGASHVLEGSVRKAAVRVRITAQLIDGATGNHLWAERYDRDLDDIFALQDEISQAIVAALKLKLLPEEKKAIEKRGTTSAEAYDLYLMARQYREIGNSDSRRDETIIRLCQRAIEVDPNYAQAWTLIGAAQLNFRNYGQPGDGGEAAIQQALRLDPDLGEAHAVRAVQLHQAARRDEAFAELELALRQDPDSFDVNWRAGNIYYQERRFADAVGNYAKAITLSERDYSAPGMMMSALVALGDEDAARRAAVIALERAEKALAQERNNGRATAYGVQALALLGQRDRAREWIDRALLLDPDNSLARYNFACALSRHLQDADGALALLGPALAAKNTNARMVAAAKSDPDLDPIRGDPRFQALLAETEARQAAAKTPS